MNWLKLYGWPDLITLPILLGQIAAFCARPQYVVHKPEASASDEKAIYVLLPVFDEANTINASIRYFVGIAEACPGVKIVVLMTARENRTYSALSDDLKKHRSITILFAPIEYSSKAAQLNYGIDKLTAVCGGDYLAIFDVDSRPRPAVFQEVQRRRSEGKIFQQHGLFLANIDDVFMHPILYGLALSQSRWTISQEMARFCAYKNGLIPGIHLVGHGLFIRREVLAKYGGFPEETEVEDAHLGFYLSAEHEPICSLNEMDDSDVPVRVSGWFRQALRWSAGPREAFVYRKIFARKFLGANASGLRLDVLTYWTFFMWVVWALTSPAILFGTLTALDGYLSGILWLAFNTILLWADLRLIKRLSGNRINVGIYSLFSVACYSVIGSVPVIIAGFSEILGRRLTITKSEHF